MLQSSNTKNSQTTPFQKAIANLLADEIGGDWSLQRVLEATEAVRRSLDLGEDALQAALCGESEVVVLIYGSVLKCCSVAGSDAAPLAETGAAGHALEYRADSFLTKGVEHMQDRAEQYDSPEGERSMESAVEAFNAITGCDLNESEGWTFMQVLKLVRANQGGPFNPDHYEDLAAYAGLHGESAAAYHRRLHSGMAEGAA